MKTIKPIATISYNSWPFLTGVLERLKKEGFIQFYAFIHHEPEEDELKGHCHVFVEPFKRIDTEWLQKQFIEMDKSNPNKPLGVMPWKSSQFRDWYWYSLHDVAYLLSKGQTRKKHYDPYCMVSSDDEYLREMVKNNPCPASDIYKVMEYLKKGYKAIEIAMLMNVSMSRLAFFLGGINALVDNVKDLNETYRNGQLNHEPTSMLLLGKPTIDSETGEIKHEIPRDTYKPLKAGKDKGK